jgi:hypothetical protein
MKWQAVLGVGAAGVLLLPLAVLLSSVLHPKTRVESLRGRPVSPVLDVEARTSLQTYRRNCVQSADCEPPLGCVVDPRVWITYCSDSQCMTDGQCSGWTVSRAVVRDGPNVRREVPAPWEAATSCASLRVPPSVARTFAANSLALKSRGSAHRTGSNLAPFVYGLPTHQGSSHLHTL